MAIPIPDLLACLNDRRRDGFADTSKLSGGKPGDCLGCGKCEEICPQKLNIREQLRCAREEL